MSSFELCLRYCLTILKMLGLSVCCFMIPPLISSSALLIVAIRATFGILHMQFKLVEQKPSDVMILNNPLSVLETEKTFQKKAET